MKIAIIGNGGSGKSTLGKALHKKLGIPLYHLDQYYWKPGWQKPTDADFEKIHHQLCDNDNSIHHSGGPASRSLLLRSTSYEEHVGGGWIIEGVATRHFAYRASKADIIIFLDIPTWLCLYRIVKRSLLLFGTVRDSSAPGCPEKFPDRAFFRFVWTFNTVRKPFIEDILEEYKTKKRIFVIRNNNDFDKVVKNII